MCTKPMAKEDPVIEAFLAQIGDTRSQDTPRWLVRIAQAGGYKFSNAYSGRCITVSSHHTVVLGILRGMFGRGRCPNDQALDRWYTDFTNTGILLQCDTRPLTSCDSVGCVTNQHAEQPKPRGLRSHTEAQSQWRKSRMAEIAAAVQRYMLAGLSIPATWMVEYEELVQADKKG